jgi:predicted metal-dependent phosphoesterase TrpH
MKARDKKLDIIGITDHNSAENVEATVRAAREQKIAVLCGMEIGSAEETHVIGLFDSPTVALQLQSKVYDHLTPGENKDNIFGEQIVANEFDEVEGYSKRLLISSTTLTLSEIVSAIHTLGGIVIASHIDRESFSIIGQLGFIPPDLELDAVEISSYTRKDEILRKFPDVARFPTIIASDAHFLDDIGMARTSFLLEKPTIEEIRMALRNQHGRSLKIETRP